MEENIARLINVSQKILESTREDNSSEVTKPLERAIRDLEANPDTIVQLYSVSQAGKSTLVSLLTKGEQYVPVGVGTATTAVVIELISVAANERESAQVSWLSPDELRTMVIDPLEPFITRIAQTSTVRRGRLTARKRVASVDHQENPRENPNNNLGENLFLEDVDTNHHDIEGEDIEDESDTQITPYALKNIKLSDPQVRRELGKALQRAYAFRRAEMGEVGGNDDLVAAEVILSFFKNYLGAYKPGYHSIPLHELSLWTRQPYDWGQQAHVHSYLFDQVRCFFVKRVRLYAQTAPMVHGLRIIDAPGFGVSRVHDRISRSIQEQSDAVILLLGSSGAQIPTSQLREVQQLAMGLRDNLFVVWNPKSGTRTQATNLLPNDLARLREAAGVSVPENRAKVANLLLALRCMQWQTFADSEKPLATASEATITSLCDAARFTMRDRPYSDDRARAQALIRAEMKTAFTSFIGDPEIEVEDKRLPNTSPDSVATAGASQSGWEDALPELFNSIRAARRNRRAEECAARAIDAIVYAIAGQSFARQDSLKRDIETIEWLITHFPSQVKSAIAKFEEQVGNGLDDIFTDLVQSLTDEANLSKLRSGVASVITGETSASALPMKIRAKVIDYTEARCSLWSTDIVEYKTTNARTYIRLPYEQATRSCLDWLKEQAGIRAASFAVDLPDAALPVVTMAPFREAYLQTFTNIAELAFTPDVFSRFISFVSEAGKKTVASIKRGFNQFVSWFTGEESEEEPAKPLFDHAKAKEKSLQTVKEIFETQSIQYLLLVDASAFKGFTFLEHLSSLAEAILRSDSGLLNQPNQVLFQANDSLIKEREQRLTKLAGPALVGANTIVSGMVSAIESYQKAVLDTLHMLRDNLILQLNTGLPSINPDRLEELKAMLEDVTGSIIPDADLSIRVAHARHKFDEYHAKSAEAEIVQ